MSSNMGVYYIKKMASKWNRKTAVRLRNKCNSLIKGSSLAKLTFSKLDDFSCIQKWEFDRCTWKTMQKHSC